MTRTRFCTVLLATILCSAISPKRALSQSCCTVPDGEDSTAIGGSRGLTLFAAQVFDSNFSSFEGLDVEESVGLASNGCWYNGSPIPQTFSLQAGLDETIDSNNEYLDYIGFNDNTIHNLQTASDHGVAFPCSVTFNQIVHIYCPFVFDFVPYTVNGDAVIIEDKFDISNCRQGACDGPFIYAP